MNSAKADRSMQRPGAARAFTLTELLVVITLLVIVIAVGLPAFGAMLASSNRTLAIGQFKAAMSAARDAAIRSTDSDSAAVFFFEPGGRMTIVPCVQVGTVQDRDHLNWNQYPNFTVKRDVFAPAGSSEPIQLPPGWMVRAFAGSAMLDDGNANATGWYGEVPGSREYNADNGSWVFPETGFFNQDADRDTGANNRTLRQTFMVRFEKGTGNLVVNQAFPSVVLAPRSSEQGAVTRVVGTPLETDWRRVDRTDNVAQWARRLLARRVDPSAAVGSGKVLPGDLAALIGDESGDTVLASSVDLVSLYEEKTLAASIGARGLNRYSASIYAWGEPGNANAPVPNEPRIDTALFTGQSPQVVQQRVDDWIVGTLRLDGRQVESDALIYGFDRYTGQPREVKP
jgi:prepilin-type N-terminal cleavage/methylation domain-containing protein